MILPDVAVAAVDDLLDVGLRGLPGAAIAAPLVGAAARLSEGQQEAGVGASGGLALGTPYGTGEGAAVCWVKAPLALANEHPVLLEHVGPHRGPDVDPDVPRGDFFTGRYSNLGPDLDGVAATRRSDGAL